ncbi:MAG: hypothetical protein LH618_18000 [Saprospiraceae bacterium]|nr:hypothetical protein [Saprospiraceae bacterium]
MKYIFFWGFLTLLFAHCQTPTAPRQFLQCYVRFDAVAGQVQADAIVRNGPNTLPDQPVEMPGGMLYQGSLMQVLPVQGLTYRRSYAADFVPEHTFGWVDAQGMRQKVVFPMSPISKFSFGVGPLLRSKPATLRWEGGPLEKGEALVLMWENRSLGQTVPMEIMRSGGDASIEFPAAKIAEVPAGQWTLYLVRKRLAKTEIPGMAAEAVLEYYSKSDTIEVK